MCPKDPRWIPVYIWWAELKEYCIVLYRFVFFPSTWKPTHSVYPTGVLLITDCGYTEHDVPINATLTPHNASLPDCPAIYTLRRIENPGIRFSVEYSFSPALDKLLMTILNARLTLVQFNVAPMKDTGGTLTFRASLESLSVCYISILANRLFQWMIHYHSMNIIVGLCRVKT